VLEKDTLGGTRATGRVHDAAQIFWLWRHSIDRVVFAHLDKIVEAGDCEMVVGALELVNVGLLDFGVTVVDDMLNVLGLLQGIDEFGEKVRVEENGLGMCLLERVLEAFLSERVVCGDNWHGLGRSACKALVLWD